MSRVEFGGAGAGLAGRIGLASALAAACLASAAAPAAAPDGRPEDPALTVTMTGPGDPRAAEADYVIGVEDLIQVTVWKNPDLSITAPVRPDGRISLPLIDDVQAAGLTPMKLKDELTRRWKAFLSAPEVSVVVKEVNSFKVYLVGEVARPGELRLKARTRLLQALSLAGGLTGFADRDRIILLRESEGGEVRFEVNYKKLISGARPEDNLILRPGDTIVVP
jgi:polysaccharide export outer membrane protein